MTSVHCGRYSMYYDLKYTDAMLNYETLNRALLSAKNVGNFLEKEKLCIALSEDQPTFLDKETRAAINIHSLYRYYHDRDLKISSLNDADIELILRVLMKTPYEKKNLEGKIHKISGDYIKMLTPYMQQKAYIKIIQLLLCGKLISYLPFQQEIGRLLLHQNIPHLFPKVRTVNIEEFTNFGNNEFKVSVESSESVFSNFIENAIEESAKRNLVKLQEIERVQHFIIEKSGAKRSTSKLPRLVDIMFGNPIIDTTFIKEKLSISHVGADKLLNRLIDCELISPIGKRTRGSKFISREIMSL